MKFFLFILSSLLSLGLLAQQPYHLSINDAAGLPSNIAYHVMEDANGFVWVATTEGLSRYDGRFFKEYKNTAQTSLPGSNVQEDSKGRIWYQNFDGYCYFVLNDALQPLQQHKPLGFLPMGITKAHIFLVQTKGVDVYDVETLQRIKTITFDKEMAEIYHTAAQGNSFYVLTSTGLFEVNDKLLGFSKNQNPAIALGKYNQMHPCNGKLILSRRFNDRGVCAILHPDNRIEELRMPDFSVIHAIYAVGRSYWVLTPNGAYVFENGKYQKQLFPNYSLSSVFKDKNQNIWVSTTQKGLLLIPSLASSFYPITRFEPNLIEKVGNTFLLFSQNGEILALDNAFKEQNKVYSSASHSAFYYTYQDTSNRVLFASSSGVNMFQTRPFKALGHSQLAVKEIVKIDASYYAMASSGNAFLYKTKSKTPSSHWDSFAQHESLTKSDGIYSFITDVRAKTIAYDSAVKAIYIGTNLGLFKQTVSMRSEIKHQQKALFISKLVSYGGILYALNTHGELLKIVNDKVVAILNTQENIQIGAIKSIKAFGSNLCIMGESRFLVLDMRQDSKPCFVLPIPIKTSEINDVLLDGTQLHLVLRGGIITTPFIAANRYKKTTQFVITGFELSGKPLAQLPEALAPSQNQMSVHYALLNYANVEKANLWYKINNEDWVLCEPNLRSLQFAYLAPGNYQIQFKLNDTLLSKQRIFFTINKPIWQQLWFIILCGILILAIGVSYYKWQISLLLKKNKLVTEKMELENALNVSRLKAIKSQMNPHFFYNALNTIQSYIFTNDKKRASNYLGKFSNLTRMILEMSEMDLVGLNQELKALNLYLELEQMRFEEDLHCSIEVDELLDTEMIKLPPMLVQPFIENALKHGLMHKAGNKILQVTFKPQQEGFIQVIIDDNGIGREQAGLINKNKFATHQSFASEANQQRLNILHKGKNSQFSLSIIDKQNQYGASLGTQVILIIPIN
ncbi:MAG: histidine kinase [Bacteroidota bacterium]|nr:histidine kinase [Bacteroidota bacterium]